MADWPVHGLDPWDVELKAYIDDLAESVTGGTELGYAERVTNYTTTEATPFAAAIDALQVEVTGTGRPVDVEFFASDAHHSVADTFVYALLVVDGVYLDANGQLAATQSTSTTLGSSLYFKKRIVLDESVDYQFNVVLYGGAAGTSTLVAAAFAPTFLSVVSR